DLVEILAIDHVESEQLLLGFCEWPIKHERRVLILTQRRRRRGRHQPRHRTELARGRQRFVHRLEARHDGGVLLLAPGADDVLGVVAKNGVLHIDFPRAWNKDARAGRRPTMRRGKSMERSTDRAQSADGSPACSPPMSESERRQRPWHETG